MKHQPFTAVFALLAVVLLLISCSSKPDTRHVGPVGPQGIVGAQPLEGTPPPNLTIIEDTYSMVTNEYAFNDFSQVEISGSFDVTIRQGEGFGVRAQIEETAVPYVQIAQEGDLLTIRLDPGRTYHMVNITLDVEITVPELARLVLEGGAEATVIGLEGFQSEEDFLSELHNQ